MRGCILFSCRARVGGAPARLVTQGPLRARVAARAGVEAGKEEEDRLNIYHTITAPTFSFQPRCRLSPASLLHLLILLLATIANHMSINTLVADWLVSNDVLKVLACLTWRR